MVVDRSFECSLFSDSRLSDPEAEKIILDPELVAIVRRKQDGNWNYFYVPRARKFSGVFSLSIIAFLFLTIYARAKEDMSHPFEERELGGGWVLLCVHREEK